MKFISFVSCCLLFITCNSPFVNTFEEIESAVIYSKDDISAVPAYPDSIKVMTWNIRFGVARAPWFGDSCGDRVLMTSNDIETGLSDIINFIDTHDPDILLIQEIDVDSKRSAYINQLNWIMDNSSIGLNYAAYASMWEADYIPSDGLGKVNAGNAILSKYPLSQAERVQLPLREDQPAYEQYFYLRRNYLRAKVDILSDKSKPFYALVVHATAFATDDTKQKHITTFKMALDSIDNSNAYFVAGGDFNAVPSGANIDYCEYDRCVDEVCDQDYKNNKIYQGSYFKNFENEPFLMDPFYTDYYSAILKEDTNNSEHFTHSTYNFEETYSEPDSWWNRKLDYLFTNYQDWSSTGQTYQGNYNDIKSAFHLSDHAPISATIFIND